MINWGKTALVGIDAFTSWHWLPEISWHRALLPRYTPPLVHLKKNSCVVGSIISSCRPLRGRTPCMTDRGAPGGAGLPCGFSVSAFCLEDDSASVTWCMRTSRRRRLSAEQPRLWRGYLKLFCFFYVNSHDSQLNKCGSITWPNTYESPTLYVNVL